MLLCTERTLQSQKYFLSFFNFFFFIFKNIFYLTCALGHEHVHCECSGSRRLGFPSNVSHLIFILGTELRSSGTRAVESSLWLSAIIPLTRKEKKITNTTKTTNPSVFHLFAYLSTVSIKYQAKKSKTAQLKMFSNQSLRVSLLVF